MRRTSSVCRALRSAFAVHTKNSNASPAECSSSTTRMGAVQDESTHLSNRKWFAAFNRQDSSSREMRKIWDLWEATASVGLFIGAATVPLWSLNDATFSDKVKINMTNTSSSSEGKVDTEMIVQQVRKGVEERLRLLKLNSLLPLLEVTAKGQQVSIRFPVSSRCDMSHLIVDIITHLGGRVNEGKRVGNEMNVQAWDSTVSRQLIISPPELSQDDHINELSKTLSPTVEDNVPKANKLCVLIFEPLVGDYKATEVEFLKKGFLTPIELDAIVSSLMIAFEKKTSKKESDLFSPEGSVEAQGESYKDGDSCESWSSPRRRSRFESSREEPGSGGSRFSGITRRKTLEALEKMGVKVYGNESTDAADVGEQSTWGTLAGYHEQKREIEDTVLLALKQPEVYDNIARGTRRKFESNRPRAVLFEGPPGTGKTSFARVIANQAGVPLLYVPLEIIMSKYFGESERLLAAIFDAGNDLPDGAILFLDEIDSLATVRDSDMHEATRRILSVLLRQMDGFERDKKIVVIAATNRKQDLDPALLSRFDLSILFHLPDLNTRQEIAAQYARHLSTAELASFAAVSDGMSGRDIHDVCQQSERRWASKLIRGLGGDTPRQELPPIQEYIDCAEKRQQTVVQGIHEHYFRGSLLARSRDNLVA